MKQFKLLIHQKNFSEESLLINPKDYPTLSIGDVVEIYSPEYEYSRLLLQVKSFPSDLPHKDTISIEQSIASQFQLRAYAEVIVNVINPKDVALDSVELTFKDQYLARSDMWRLKKCLVNTCVYPNKKIEFYGIRCQVFEMYAQGERVASGIVTEDTKIVYRSASSMVYLFIQMSSEMWHFDINGDLYFEKAVDGFLSDLFAKWKKLSCNHDVTIVLFSRTFYEAQSSDEFPSYMRECLQQDYKGRFFEDFYRVAVQNERYDDWSSTVILLKKLFNQYQEMVLGYHRRPNENIPRALNSTSSQGNFLEVLNMSLNVFAKHYMDRSFDRTGQLSVVISPGVGVFEVDRELTNITKQRIIDNGIGSDLVCLGEQPLHAVPLFKFHNKQCQGNSVPVMDDYNMPHWINLSFYSSTKQISYSNFIPRIKLPSPLPRSSKEKRRESSLYSRSRHVSQPDPSFPVLFDYDEYDSQVFKLPAHSQGTRHTRSLQRPGRRKETPPNCSQVTVSNRKTSEDVLSKLTASDPAPVPSHSHASSAAIAIPSRNSYTTVSVSSFQNSIEIEHNQQRQCSKDDIESEFSPPFRSIVGSAGSPYEPQFTKQLFSRRPKALVNPFDPSHVTIKLTSNRRRWTHVFPLGPTGIFMQQHHYQAIPQSSAATLIPLDGGKSVLSSEQLQLLGIDISHYKTLQSNVDTDGVYESKTGIGKKDFHSSASTASLTGIEGRPSSSGIRIASSLLASDPHTDRSLSWLWGATGEQEWTPAITTGVDWKSLVVPACLPITTDYFPDKRSLQNDYVISDYFLVPEDIIAENTPLRYYRSDEDSKLHRPMTTPEVYNELICQRLQQGFQIILLSKQHPSYPHTQVSSSPQFAPPLLRGRQKAEQLEEYLLSIGRIFHKLTLDGSTITVTQYRPRHPYREIKIHYCYRFHAPDGDTYGVSWVDFKSEKLENYGWNYLDHYICMKGEGEFELKDSLKFWRLRLLLLPGVQTATRQIIDGSEYCDLYNEFSLEAKIQQREGFLKFVEMINGIRRSATKKQKVTTWLPPRRSSLGQTMLSQVSSLSSSSFRDRVSSNRIHDRPRSRSHSAKMGARVETSTAAGRVSPATEADGKLSGSNTSLETQVEGEMSEDNFPTDMKRLCETSPHAEIIEAMKHTQNGLNFLCKSGLPNLSFISAEAIFWVLHNIEGIVSEQQALCFLENMVQKGLICHASGAGQHKFLHGFYLYYLVAVPEKDAKKDCDDQDEAIYFFQREWMEVELYPLQTLSPVSLTYTFPSDEDIWSNISESKLKFKCTNIEIDQGTKSGRMEWGQARYQSIYEPYEAFEIVVEWMVATGNIASEMVQGWARKSASYSLQLVPIPSDPFALPFSADSDPLRGPIFIPLDLFCLLDSILEGVDEDGLLMFQEKILCKFGFLPYRNPAASNPPQYVHISGSMFVMIPIDQKQSKKNEGPRKQSLDLHHISSPHDEYITRHFSGIKKKDYCPINLESDARIGFLWSWNYMITKRWKTSGTVDEIFMRKVMRDFMTFCANQNNRLQDFWKSSQLPDFPQDNSMLMSLES